MKTGQAVPLELDNRNEHTDEEIVRQVLAGDTALFAVLMRRYNERLYRAARSIIRDDREAEDVMQQAYVNAYSHLQQFDGRARFGTWLTRIAVHEALSRVRRRGRYEPFDDGLTNVDPFQPFDAHQMACRTVRGKSSCFAKSRGSARRRRPKRSRSPKTWSRPGCHGRVPHCAAFCWSMPARPHRTPSGSTVRAAIASSPMSCTASPS
jgi:RNA polymerase sigma factor (sigma-70 family)